MIVYRFKYKFMSLKQKYLKIYFLFHPVWDLCLKKSVTYEKRKKKLHFLVLE